MKFHSTASYYLGSFPSASPWPVKNAGSESWHEDSSTIPSLDLGSEYISDAQCSPCPPNWLPNVQLHEKKRTVKDETRAGFWGANNTSCSQSSTVRSDDTEYVLIPFVELSQYGNAALKNINRNILPGSCTGYMIVWHKSSSPHVEAP
jgi:hypothetical protein